MDSIDWKQTLECDPHTQQWHEKPLYPYLSELSDFGKAFIQTYYEDETGMNINKAYIGALHWLLERMKGYEKLLTYKKSSLAPNRIIN